MRVLAVAALIAGAPVRLVILPTGLSAVAVLLPASHIHLAERGAPTRLCRP